MKKYIRDMIDDLKGARKARQTPVINLTPKPEPVVPQDLSNQELSKDPAERVKQLDYQAFQSERRQTNS